MIETVKVEVQDALLKYFNEAFVLPNPDVFASDCAALILEAVSDGVPCHEVTFYFVEDAMNALSSELGFSKAFLDNKRKGLSYLEAKTSIDEQCLRAAFMFANALSDPDKDFEDMTKGEM